MITPAGSTSPATATAVSVQPAGDRVLAARAARGESASVTAPKKTAAKKTAAKKTAAKKSAAKKSAAKKTAAATAAGEQPAPKKSAAKKTAVTKTAAKKTAVTETVAKKTAAKKTAAKKTAAKKTSAGRTGQTGRTTTVKTTANNRHTTPVPAASLAVRGDEDPWTDAELAEIRAELTAEIERHESQARDVSADLADLLVSAEGGAGDAADIGTSNFERDQEMTLAAHAQEALTQARLALAKMDDGTYGVCDSCGEPIGKGRLQAHPRATLCVRCKQREERR